MEWIIINCPYCGKELRIRKNIECKFCKLIIELNQDAIPLGMANKVKIICEE